jgi:hypothetical protein
VSVDDERREDRAAIHEFAAPHVGAEYDLWRAHCGDALRATPELHHVAHYSTGIYNFDADVFDLPGVADRLGDRPATWWRSEIRRTGRQLTFQAEQMNQRLQFLGTGDLIRTVLDGDQGAVICNRVIPGVYLVGCTISAKPVPPDRAADVRAADSAMADLVTRLRVELSRSPQNPGGFRPTWADEAQGGEALNPDDLFIGGADPEGARLAGSSLRVRGLHLATLFRAGTPLWTVDILRDPRLGKWHTDLSVSTRRRSYAEIGREMEQIATGFGRASRASLRGPLRRLVLDLEQGAIYFYRTGPVDYLVGVTLDQSRVADADLAVGVIAGRLVGDSSSVR